MEFREPKESEKETFNSIVTHPLQSWEWGEFREKTGIKVIRRIAFDKQKAVYAFQVTIHKIPRISYTIGYIPKGLMPSEEVLEELKKIGKEEGYIFVKLEPNVEISPNILISQYPNIHKSSHPLFTKYTFQLDLTKSEEELLKNMYSKTRYNIRVAQKHGVTIEEDNSDTAFEEYIRLMKETTTRQKYYAHTIDYHRKMWETLKSQNNLSAHLLVATYKGKTLVAWIVFVFNGVLYYPYGASSSEHREVMASNLMMWEAIRFGKKMGCSLFDMWGSLGPNPNTQDPWYGFHRFKEGYGAKLVEFIGSYDLILNLTLYQFYNLAHRARWIYLRMKK
jgi:lipid II:glycine glycyltransferase (peptidoglycan interpeptide bridge formation enzyme)